MQQQLAAPLTAGTTCTPGRQWCSHGVSSSSRPRLPRPRSGAGCLGRYQAPGSSSSPALTLSSSHRRKCRQAWHWMQQQRQNARSKPRQCLATGASLGPVARAWLGTGAWACCICSPAYLACLAACMLHPRLHTAGPRSSAARQLRHPMAACRAGAWLEPSSSRVMTAGRSCWRCSSFESWLASGQVCARACCSGHASVWLCHTHSAAASPPAA
jgi:hypothetical protein